MSYKILKTLMGLQPSQLNLMEAQKMYSQFFRICSLFLVFLPFFSKSILAYEGPPLSDKKWQWLIQEDFIVEPEISFKDSNTELFIWSSQTKLSWTHRLNRKVSWGLRLNFEHYRYDINFSSQDLTPNQENFSQLFRLRAGPFVRIQWSKRWSSLFQVLPDISAAYGANWGDSFQMTSLAFTSYQLSNQWSLSFGALLFAPRIEDQILVIPILGFDYKPSKNWRLGIGEGQSGPGLYVYHNFRPGWMVKLNIDWALREFRLDNESPLPSGIFEDMSVPLRLGLEWQGPHQWKVEPFVGTRLWSRFEYFDSQGKSLDTNTTYPSFFFGLTLKKSLDF